MNAMFIDEWTTEQIEELIYALQEMVSIRREEEE
jgi:hypothetical protein